MKALTLHGLQQLKDIAKTVHNSWEETWTVIENDIHARGETILCKNGCNHCCFTRKFCALSEGVRIGDYMQKHFPAERYEHFRLRIESAKSSLAKLRAIGLCNSEKGFFRSGGLECPFLENGSCAIYPVRPIDCRTQLVLATTIDVVECRICPRIQCCMESDSEYRKLRKVLLEQEEKIGFQLPVKDAMIPEVMSLLWEKGTEKKCYLMTEDSWELRLQTRRSSFDGTWQDDRHDLTILKANLSLPDEGDYYPDFTLLRQSLAECELYNQKVAGEIMPEFYSLYKRRLGSSFDWSSKEFVWGEKRDSGMPYTIWMSDHPQERLMMWEAAKRCRGKVLCGGLGLGVFPQMALSLPQVESIHVIEMDKDIIKLIQEGWRKKPWPRASRCRVSTMKIEDYLTRTNEKYDTVYIDTWDAIYHEYLPQVNEFSKLSERVLKPGGEILMWAFDMMVQHFLRTISLLYRRREQYCRATSDQMQTIADQYPLLHKVVTWLRENPTCSRDSLLTRAYKVATREKKNLGILKVGDNVGAQSLINEKYFRGIKGPGVVS